MVTTIRTTTKIDWWQSQWHSTVQAMKLGGSNSIMQCIVKSSATSSMVQLQLHLATVDSCCGSPIVDSN